MGPSCTALPFPTNGSTMLFTRGWPLELCASLAPMATCVADTTRRCFHTRNTAGLLYASFSGLERSSRWGTQGYTAHHSPSLCVSSADQGCNAGRGTGGPSGAHPTCRRRRRCSDPLSDHCGRRMRCHRIHHTEGRNFWGFGAASLAGATACATCPAVTSEFVCGVRSACHRRDSCEATLSKAWSIEKIATPHTGRSLDTHLTEIRIASGSWGWFPPRLQSAIRRHALLRASILVHGCCPMSSW